MALSTKSLLKTEVSERLDNPSWYASRADNLLILAEARLNRLLDGRLGRADTALTGVVDSRELTLPTDFVEPVELWRLETTGERVELVPKTVSSLAYQATSGVPSAFAINNDAIDLDCPCSSAITFKLHYVQSLSLTLDADTNWLLSSSPDAYLLALLIEAHAFRGNVQEAALWDQRLQETIEALNWRDARSDAQATLSVDPALMGRRAGFDINTGE